MSTTTTTMTVQTRAERLLQPILAGFNSRAATVLTRWRWGQVTQPMVAVTINADTPAEIAACQTVAVGLVRWHSGRLSVHRGKPGTSLGRALRQAGKPGGYGPKDPAAVRAMDRVLAAETYPDLHEAVLAVLGLIGSVDHPPHWATLIDDLVCWQGDRSARDRVRGGWVRDFHTHTAKTDPEPTPSTSQAKTWSTQVLPEGVVGLLADLPRLQALAAGHGDEHAQG